MDPMLAAQFSYFLEQTAHPTMVARSYSPRQGCRMVDYTDWTCGFTPGSMWLLYELTGQEQWKKAAELNTEKLEKVHACTHTHDLGFMAYCSYGNGYRLTGNRKYREILLQTADTLCRRYDPRIGSIRSWDFGPWKYPVIIDNLMNLELLCWASRETGDPRYRRIAVNHADNTRRDHFRADMSSYHVVSYDPAGAAVETKGTHQGLHAGSAWGRGQAWGLYGFTLMYRETGDRKYRETASGIAGYILANLPPDRISYWDYNDPRIPDAPRDASAAAITAAALFELAGTGAAESRRYREAAEAILHRLNAPEYRAAAGTNGGFLLMHSVGNMPAGSEIDVAINYADYYYLEALKRQRNQG